MGQLLSAPAQEYLDEQLRLGEMNGNTYKMRMGCLKSAEAYFGGVPVHKLTRLQILKWINRPSARSVAAGKPQRVSPSTRWNSFQAAKHFFLWYAEQEDVSDDILGLVMSEGDKAPVAWSLPEMDCYSFEDVRNLFRAAQEDSGRPAIAARNTMMMAFAYFMALRTDSIASIKLDSVDWDTRTCRTKVKNKGIQTVDIPKDLVGPLRDYVDNYRRKIFKKHPDTGFLFPSNRGKKISLLYMHEICENIVKRSGVQRHKYRGFHGLRRAGLTHAHLHEGMSIMLVKALAMQENIETTSHYVQPNREMALDNFAGIPHRGVHANTMARFRRKVLARLKLKE